MYVQKPLGRTKLSELFLQRAIANDSAAPSMSDDMGTNSAIAFVALGGAIFFIFLVFVSAMYLKAESNPAASPLPVGTSPGETAAERAKRRLQRLDNAIRPDSFKHWLKTDHQQHPEVPTFDIEDQVCVICLDEIQSDQSIRALNCRHIYHTACFDSWFRGFGHDFCPLCHRQVISQNIDKGGKAAGQEESTREGVEERREEVQAESSTTGARPSQSPEIRGEG